MTYDKIKYILKERRRQNEYGDYSRKTRFDLFIVVPDSVIVRNSGTFLKATDDLQQPKIYYKLSNYDGINGIVGHECINEIIVDRLLNILEIEHLHYDLIHADIDVDGKEMETYLCASKDFKAHGEHKVALDAYYQAEN